MKFFKALPLFLICLMLCSCGTDGQEDQSDTLPASGTNPPSIESVAQANSLESLLAAHKNISTNTIYYDSTGTDYYSTSSITYSDGETNAMGRETSDGYVEYTEDNMTYIFDSADNRFHINLMLDDSSADYVSKWGKNVFSFFQNEKQLSSAVDGQNGVLTTELKKDSQTAAFSDYIPDLGEYSSVKFVYTCNADTNELSKIEAFAVNGDSEQRIMKKLYDYSDDAFDLPEYVYNLKKSENLRTVTLRRDGKTQTYQIDDQALFSFTPPEGFSLFTDPSGKTSAAEADLTQGDAEFYLLKNR